MKTILYTLHILALLAATSYAGYTDPVTGMEFILVKGGCYQMGDAFGDGKASEQPVHEVCVSDFQIGKYEVTQAQYQAVMKTNPSIFKGCGSNCPVENVSYEDAKEFTRQLNDLTTRNYRLPYEAEWEYAARSGGKNEQFAGTSDLDDLGEYAWFADNSGEKTHPTGTRRPNGLGIYDMNGNVWEWCKDWYDGNYYKNSLQKTPHGPLLGSRRVYRGGSWNFTARDVRVTNRNDDTPRTRTDFIGFRLVLPAIQ